MNSLRIVVDSNVIVAGLISNRGRAFRLLTLLGNPHFEVFISTPLILEYEDVIKRLLGTKILLSEPEVEAVLDYICGIGQTKTVHFLWRPFLRDPKDDLMLELAVSASCHFIVTYNLRHFEGVEQFGVSPIVPAEFLKRLGDLP